MSNRKCHIPSLHRARERRALSLMALTMMRNTRLRIRQVTGRRTHPGEALVLLAVTLGHAENNLMSPHDIGLYLDMARPTVARICQSLEDAGMITREGTRYRLSDTQAATHQAAAVLDRTVALFRKLARDL